MSAVISLEDRGVVEIAGADATKFLHNLVTNDIAKLGPGDARFCALLAPQGKILVDFLVFVDGEGESRRYLLDCPRDLEADLLRRLGFYKLRAVVTFTSKSDELAAYAVLGEARPEYLALALARDPRSEALGGGSSRRAGRWRRSVCARITRRRAWWRAFRGARWISPMATRFRTRPTWISWPAWISPRAAMSARKSSRDPSTAMARKRVDALSVVEGDAPPPGTKVMAGESRIGVAGSRNGDMASR